jgi:hypothetical protein
MKLVTYNLYPFVIESLKEADHQLIQTNKSSKLPFLLEKYKPDASIVFGWDKPSLSALHNESIIFPNDKQKALLSRQAATRQLHILTRIDNRYSQYIGYLRTATWDKDYLEWAQVTGASGIDKWVVKVGDEHQGKGKYLCAYNELSTGFLLGLAKGKDVVVEPYVQGRSIRALVLGSQVYLVEQKSEYWIKNQGTYSEEVLPHDSLELLVDDALYISNKLGIGLLGIDYQVSGKDPRDILPLEINVMPGIPDLMEDQAVLDQIRQNYSQVFVDLVNSKAGSKAA